MSNILLLVPSSLAAFGVSRGSGAENLLRPDPREIWLDSAVGSAVTIDMDLGVATSIDTVFLGCLYSASQDATWTITGGVAAYDELTLKAAGDLRVPERAGRVSHFSHAFWHGDDVLVRYVRISITQPAGASPLGIGVLMIGSAFVPEFNQVWGSGRAVKDTGSVTRLPSGGIAVVEGARYGSYKWSLEDLSNDEIDLLYEIQLDRGETRRVLVVEDPDQTPGLRNRIHYGLLTGLRPSSRKSATQGQWELAIEDWVSESDAVVLQLPTPAMTLGGTPISFGGEILTIGA